MIHSIIQYGKLIGLILRKGKLHTSGADFNQRRMESLNGLQEFVPASYQPKGSKTSQNKKSILKNLIGQVAFVKNAFKVKGGHLRSAALHLSYIRIPKSASTSMSMAMLEKIYPALKDKSITEEQINFLTDANLENSIESSSSDTFFTIVRNPFARLVSVYHDFFETKESNFIYSEYLFGVITPELSFSEFVNRLHMIPDLLKDQHLKPQSNFLQYYERKNIKIITLKLEEPEKVNAFLDTYFLQLPHRNKSQRGYQYEEYYTPLTLQKVYDIYRVDIEKFGYQNTYSALLAYTKSTSNA